MQGHEYDDRTDTDTDTNANANPDYDREETCVLVGLFGLWFI